MTRMPWSRPIRSQVRDDPKASQHEGTLTAAN